MRSGNNGGVSSSIISPSNKEVSVAIFTESTITLSAGDWALESAKDALNNRDRNNLRIN